MARVQFKVGEYIRVKRNLNGYMIDTKYRLTRVDNSDDTIKAEYAETPGTEGAWLNFSHVTHWAISKEDLVRDIERAKATIEENQSMLAWMEETGADVFNENEFKVWQVLTAMDDTNLSKLDKVKRIAQMINS